jgi:hypothetical protein
MCEDPKEKACTATYINKKHAVKDWETLTISTNATAHTVLLGGQYNTIWNIYEPHDTPTFANSAARTVTEWAAERIQQARSVGHIAMLGDFNAHHPEWNDARPPNTRGIVLREVAALLGLQQLLDPNTPTRIGWDIAEDPLPSTIDLIWADDTLSGQCQYTQIAENHETMSDHRPLALAFSWWGPASKEEMRRSTKRLDPKKLLETLTPKARELELKLQLTRALITINTVDTVDSACDDLIDILQESLAQATPLVRISPRSIPDFPPELKALQQTMRRTKRAWARHRSDDTRADYKATKRQLVNKIRAWRRAQWRTHLANITGDLTATWKVVKSMRTRGDRRRPHIPTLITRDDDGNPISSAEEPLIKAEILTTKFFPPPTAADLSDIQGFVYPPSIDCPRITQREIITATLRLRNNKAPGADMITNEALKLVLPTLITTMTWIFNASLDLGHYPTRFKTAITIALKKPGKKDASAVSSYRPIALLNTMGKILESVMATRLSYLVDTHGVLPPQHIGGRKAVTCDMALHRVIEAVHNAWRANKTAAILSLDVTGAFDFVSHTRLIHNLRKRRIGGRWSTWIASFLRDRSAILRLPELSTESFGVKPHPIPILQCRPPGNDLGDHHRRLQC